MVFGVSLATYTFVHVVLSLAGIVSGFVVLFGLIGGRRLDRWTAFFLATTIATSVTGYGFPVEHLLPSHVVGAISLVALAVAVVARYVFRMTGGWRRTYVVAAAVSLYLNVFVLVVQAFLKVPTLNALAPTQNEPPFAIAQGITLVAFAVLGYRAARGFRADAA
jgi:hypothetical protein